MKKRILIITDFGLLLCLPLEPSGRSIATSRPADSMPHVAVKLTPNGSMYELIFRLTAKCLRIILQLHFTQQKRSSLSDLRWGIFTPGA